MADANSHVNVPTRARRPYAPAPSSPNAGNSPLDDDALGSGHVNVPTNARLPFSATDEGGTAPFTELPSGMCEEGSFDSPQEWDSASGGWQQT